MLKVFRDVLAVHSEDGIEFDPNNLRIDLIREQLDYGGLRLSGSATIGGAVVRLVVDIGFGDALEPGVMDIAYPVLLDFPVPRLRPTHRKLSSPRNSRPWSRLVASTVA